MIKNLVNFLLLTLFTGCFFTNTWVVDQRDPSVSEYVRKHSNGILGELPIGCKIEHIAFNGKIAHVRGQVFCEETGEPFSFELWVTKLNLNSDSPGLPEVNPPLRRNYTQADPNGMFDLKFALQEGDYIAIDVIGYYPTSFAIDQYVKDALKL